MPDQGPVIGVIPARYGSTRFPGKPLAPIAGTPMICRVYERARRARLLDEVLVATDDDRIRLAVEAVGGRSVMTSPDHPSGTDRIGEVARLLPAPYYVNIQGDQPLIDPEDLDACARLLLDGAEMATLAVRIRSRQDLFDPNLARVVLSGDGYALYFSRHAIPFPRKYLDDGVDVDLDSSTYYRHVGVYGYSRSALIRLVASGPCEMEELESLEQLRALFLGIKIKVAVVESSSPCVDVPPDITRIERVIAARGAG